VHQFFGCRDVSEFPEIYKTNTIGPYLVIRALLPLIRKGEKKQVRIAFSYAILITHRNMLSGNRAVSAEYDICYQLWSSVSA